MPIVISAKISADANNQASLSSDGGVYVAPTQYPDTNPAYAIDNSGATSGSTFYYQIGGSNSAGNGLTPVTTYGVFQPMSLQRTGRLTGLTFNVTTTSTGTLYTAIYTASPNTGWPLSKVADVGGGSCASVAAVNITPAFPITLSGRTPYWLCQWVFGNAPQVSARTPGQSYPTRQASAPSPVGTFATCAVDTGSVAWNTLTSAPATAPAVSTSNNASPFIFPVLFWATITNA